MKINLANNLTMKIISLVIALVLYLFVMQERKDEKQIKYTVNIDAPDGYVLMSDVPDVTVTVKGRNRHLRQIPERNSITIRLDDPTTHLPLEHGLFPLAAGLEVQTVEPNSISLQFSELVRRTFPVRANYNGQPAEGYSVTAVNVTPAVITVEGPESAMSTLTGIFTRSVNIEGSTGNLTERVALISPGGYVSLVENNDVEVNIEIEQGEASLVVEEIPVLVSGPSGIFTLDRTTVSAVLNGPQSALERMDMSQLTASVNALPFVDMEPGSYEVRPTLVNLPQGIWEESIEPSILRLTVSEQSPIELRFIPVFNLLPFPLPSQVILPESVISGEGTGQGGG